MNARVETVEPAGALRDVDLAATQAAFERQGAFVHVDALLGAAVVDNLVAHARVLQAGLNRNYLPGHKKGGSVSRHVIDAHAPSIAALYRSPALVALLEQLCGEKLQPCPPSDPHAYALYYYTEEGDHIGWHYDTSYYDGRRYTVLFGVADDSSCVLEYELHTKDAGVAVRRGAVRLAPGDMAFFDGDRLRHRITPSGAGERRVSLTFEYVTDPHMRPWWRLVSTLKDAIAYFGLRQSFRRSPSRAAP